MWDALDPRDTDSRDRDPFDTRRAEPVHPRDVFAQELDLPHGAERGRVYVYDQEYDLRGSEVRTLATLGTFRVVPVRDLDDDRGRAPDLWHGDLDRLRSAGLIPGIGVRLLLRFYFGIRLWRQEISDVRPKPMLGLA